MPRLMLFAVPRSHPIGPLTVRFERKPGTGVAFERFSWLGKYQIV